MINLKNIDEVVTEVEGKSGASVGDLIVFLQQLPPQMTVCVEFQQYEFHPLWCPENLEIRRVWDTFGKYEKHAIFCPDLDDPDPYFYEERKNTQVLVISE